MFFITHRSWECCVEIGVASKNAFKVVHLLQDCSEPRDLLHDILILF